VIIKYQRTIKYYALCLYLHLEFKVKDIKTSPPKYVLKKIFQWANLLDVTKNMKSPMKQKQSFGDYNNFNNDGV